MVSRKRELRERDNRRAERSRVSSIGNNAVSVSPDVSHCGVYLRKRYPDGIHCGSIIPCRTRHNVTRALAYAYLCSAPNKGYNINMLLVIDIGNSAMKVGLFGAGASGRERVLARTERFELTRSITPHECADMLKDFLMDDRPKSAAIASVVPEATAAVAEAAEALTGTPPMVLTHETDSGLALAVAHPATVGADRIAGAVGAVESVGAPVAVVDFGTATTVGFVFEADAPELAVFKGGAIMPGLSLMGSSLASGTAKLPEVDLFSPFDALGRDTEQNILSGVVLGTAGAVERIVAEVERAEGIGFQVVLTGGMAHAVQGHMSRPPALMEPNLTLIGLRAIYERNI